MMWFGLHCGPGFSSGTLTRLYVTVYGRRGLVIPFIAWAVCCVFMYIGLEYSRLIHADSYRDVVGTLFGKAGRGRTVMITAWDILSLISMLMTLGSGIAGCGSQFTQDFGVSYWVGCCVFVPVMLLLLCFGQNILMGFARLSTLVIFLMIVVCAVGIHFGFSNLQAVLFTHLGDGVVPDGLTVLARSGAFYGLVQIAAFATLCVAAGKYESHSDVVWTVVFGFLINCGAMLFSDVALLAFYPGILGYELPLLGMIQQMNGAPARVLLIFYNIVIFMAYIISAGGMTIGAMVRYIPVLQKRIPAERTCRLIIIAVFFLVAIAMSTFGLDAILSTMNKIIAVFRLIFWGIPMLILGPPAVLRLRADRNMHR